MPKKVATKAPPPQATGVPLPLLVAGLLVGLYAMAPGFYLAGLNVKRGAEIVDHVVPGLVVLAMVFVAIRWGAKSVNTMAVTGMVVLLAGIWMTITHVGLFRQGLDHLAPWGPVIYHCSTALAVLALAVVWLWRYREALRDVS
ncbi:MAG: hypothetical protein ACYC1D_15045 [Acidimicrobiales bacterium]